MTFQFFETCGGKDIFLGLLRERIEALLPLLALLFRSPVAMGYVTEQRQTPKMLFIPRPCMKDNYFFAKSIGKTLCISFFMAKS